MYAEVLLEVRKNKGKDFKKDKKRIM